MALRGENNILKRVHFDKFRELLDNYVIKELNEPEDVICAINDMENPMKKYENIHKPDGMRTEEKEKLN